MTIKKASIMEAKCNIVILLKNQISERNEIMETNELDYTCGLSDEELTERFKASIRIDDEIRRIKGLPTAKYDEKKKQAYLEYPDGRIEYVS